jgi:hypothetical protein
LTRASEGSWGNLPVPPDPFHGSRVRRDRPLRGRHVKKLVVCLAVAAGVLIAPFGSAPERADARAGACGLTGGNPMWVDFGDGSVPFWDRIFRRPGLVVAASNFLMPPQLRAAGAKTVYFDLNLKTRVGTPTSPLSYGAVLDWADRMYLRAVASAGCDRPTMALNELFGAGTVTPWTEKNAQYRANVLAFVQRLASRGARPVLLVSSPPYTGGEAGEWWRQISGPAEIVRQVYFSGRHIHELGPTLGSRVMRESLRRAVRDFTAIGIHPARIGLMLGFQSRRGTGGREGLQPKEAWYRIVKLEALAARLVAHETGIGSIWSWGWASWTRAERDPDKEAAACVWLWVRNPKLCDGPAMVGPRFEASLTEGQPPRGSSVCIVGDARMTRREVNALTALTRERSFAMSTLLARLVMRERVPVSRREVLAAERAIVKARFGGSFARYGAALKAARANRAIALGAIEDALMRREIAHRIRVGRPSAKAILDYYETFAASPARPVEARPAQWWLGDRPFGLALSGVAPAKVFSLPGATVAKFPDGRRKVRVRALGEALPLGAFPLSFAHGSIRAALVEAARETRFQTWLTAHETEALRHTTCVRDELPIAASVDLTGLLPFLALP